MKTGYVTRIVDAKVFRKELLVKGNSGVIKHFGTPVLKIEDKEIVGLNGFSITDAQYVGQLSLKLGLVPEIHCRAPRDANAIFIVKHKGEWYIPELSANIAGFDEDTKNFYFGKGYLKRILKENDVNVDEDLWVMGEDGIIGQFKDYVPSYVPNLKPDYYVGLKPDATVTITDMKKSHRLDIFGDWCVYTVKGWGFYSGSYLPRFMLQKRFLISHNSMPNVDVAVRKTDAWRSVAEIVDREEPDWVKITDSEWCGAYSEASEMLNQIYEDLKANVGAGYDAIAAFVEYTSNIFVVYVDIYLRVSDPRLLEKTLRSVAERVAEQRRVATREILENVFNLK